MNALLSTYSFHSHPVRVLGTPENPLFVAADVCAVMGIANNRDAIEKLDADEKADVALTDTSSNGVTQRRNVTAVMEFAPCTHTGFLTVRAFANVREIRLPLSKAREVGQRASEFCRRHGIRTGRAKDELFGEVKSYPVEVLAKICPSQPTTGTAR